MQYHFQFAPVLDSFGDLVAGAGMTLALTCQAATIGVAIGILGAAGRLYGPPPVNWAIRAYVEVTRNTPFLVQLFFIFFGLPAAGIRISPNTAALAALALNAGAYATEILRAGLLSIPHGQIDAGRALGLRPVQIFVLIILKPALRVVYPALVSQFILTLLQSSVVSVISAQELTSVANDIQTTTFASFEVYLIVTAIYLAMTLVLGGGMRLLGQRFFAYPLAR